MDPSRPSLLFVAPEDSVEYPIHLLTIPWANRTTNLSRIDLEMLLLEKEVDLSWMEVDAEMIVLEDVMIIETNVERVFRSKARPQNTKLHVHRPFRCGFCRLSIG